MEAGHQLNIIVHVLAGATALLLGLVSLLSTKGGKIHKRSGKIFLIFLSVVIFTGLIGVFVFQRNTFLLVITALSGYVGFSGYRTLKMKSNKPVFLDITIAIATLIALAYFLYYFKSIGMIWSPVIIYSTVGALAFVILYDFVRYIVPSNMYQKGHFWLYEHIYKMTSALAALLSAFAGTVFEEYQPHSQYLPSLLGVLTIIAFMVYAAKSGLKIYKH